jgi:hypothetical protein
MKSTKYLGIWMDHSIAYLIDLSNDLFSTPIIKSKPEHKPDDQYVYKDESHLS